MKIGYICVSTEELNTAHQKVLLRELGVDELFIDKASGKNEGTAQVRLKKRIQNVYIVQTEYTKVLCRGVLIRISGEMIYLLYR